MITYLQEIVNEEHVAFKGLRAGISQDYNYLL